MSNGRHLHSVPVEQLCHGLYVAETDRPWTEIPLMFQGFTITNGDEIDVLQTHCRHVFVDAARSTPAARSALAAEIEPSAPADNAGTTASSGMRPETDTADAFGLQR